MPLTEPTRLVLAKDFTWNESIWNPSMLQAALWLDAADASTINATSNEVNQWRDKSGNARHATASLTARPTYSATAFNSRPGLVFNGIANVLRADSLSVIAQGNDSPFSIAIVFNASSGSTFRTLIGFGSSGGSSYFHALQINDTNLLAQARRELSDPLTQKTVTGTSGVSANLVVTATFSGATGVNYKNGTQDAAGDMDVPSMSTNINQFGVGALPRDTVGGYVAATVSEIIITASALNSITRQKLEGYLAHKWGLAANLPGDHPYKTVGPTP